jgi:hypothetical protein
MKLFTAIAISSLLLLSAAAYADIHTWDGQGADASWSDGDNWDQSNTVPDVGDTATMNANTAKDTIVVNSSVSSPAIVNILANTAAVSLGLQINSGYTLTSTTSVSLTGDASYSATLSGSGTLSTPSMSVNQNGAVSISYLSIPATSTSSASMTVASNSGSVQPGTLNLDGYSSTYKCTLDANNHVSATNTYISSYVTLDADDTSSSDRHISLGTTRCDADANIQVLDGTDTDTDGVRSDSFTVMESDDAAITVHVNGEGILRPTSVVITGQTNNTATLMVDASSGGIQTR